MPSQLRSRLGWCRLAGSWSAVWQSPHRLRWGSLGASSVDKSIRFDSFRTAGRIECGGVSQGSFLRSIRLALGPVTWLPAADGARRVPAFRGERGDCLLLDRPALDLADFEEIQDRVEDSVPPLPFSRISSTRWASSASTPRICRMDRSCRTSNLPGQVALLSGWRVGPLSTIWAPSICRWMQIHSTSLNFLFTKHPTNI